MRQAFAPLILGLTASPGGSEQRIDEIKRNLFIEKVEVRSEEDEDIRPYMESTALESIRVPLPRGYYAVLDSLVKLLREKTRRLVRAGFLAEVSPTKTALMRARGPLVSSLKASSEGDKERIADLLADQAQALTLMHVTELLGTQGVSVFQRHIQRLRGSMNPSDLALVRDSRWGSIEGAIDRLTGIEYPKLGRLVQVLTDQFKSKRNSRMIVFTQYRDSIDMIVGHLREAKIWATRFVGQSDRGDSEGMDQKEQTNTLDRFRAGRVKVLVSSSIGEEGLHVPDVDLVVFFEAVPSEIRSIQRKGRTGRTRPGRVVVLLAEGTVDEAYYQSSLTRERSMHSIVSREALKADR
jgi:Fanconi anemia group M protein